MLEANTRGGRTFSRRSVLRTGALSAAAAGVAPIRAFAFQKQSDSVRIFDVKRYGAVGDGKTLDGPSIQRAIDEAAAYSGKSQVLVRGGGRYLIGSLQLKGVIDFHLADDAVLLASTRKEDYAEGAAGGPGGGALIMADGAQGLTLSGTGSLQGRAREFMASYDPVGEIWIPKDFRPKMFLLTACKDLEVRDLTFAESPNWGLHMLGCERVLVDNVTVRNLLDVPNCDGIGPDHSRHVEIRNCHIRCGDDAVVVKTSRQPPDYGPASDIYVHDCVIETQDAGLKIGTETTSDIHDIRFERCEIKSGSRGLCIQLRDEGSVYNVDFRDITFTSRFFADPWWGRGEAISFTALPRNPSTKVGALHHVNVQNVTGRGENSVRVRGTAESHVRDVTFDRVAVTLERTTHYAGGLFDNRPTTAMPGIEPHGTPGFSIEYADGVTLRECSVAWGGNTADSFSYAVEAKDAPGLKVEKLRGGPARASLGKAVSIV